MRVKNIVITTAKLIEKLGIPADTSILSIRRDEHTLDFVITLEGKHCPDKPDNCHIIEELFREEEHGRRKHKKFIHVPQTFRRSTKKVREHPGNGFKPSYCY